MSIETTVEVGIAQITYESYEEDVEPVKNVQTITYFNKAQITYESYEEDVKSSIIPYPGEELYLKAIYNPIMFAFAGKAFLFDGLKIEEFGSPVVVIYPFIATVDSRIFAGGGLREDLTIEENVYGHGLDSYIVTAGRDYLAVVIPLDTVYVVDEVGNIVQKIKHPSVIALLKNWKLTSRKPFEVFMQRM